MSASKREKALARQRAERQVARAAAAAARRKQRNAVIASVVAVLLVAAGVGVLATSLSRGGSTADAAPAKATEAPPQPGECRYEKSGVAAKDVKPPPTEGVETAGLFTATLTTSLGAIAFEMDASKAPCTVNSLRSLAHFSYFDDTVCHRLTSRNIFVLQCGDPRGDGTGGPGYRFPDENLEGATYPRGTVAMANGGAGTNGSQFFLVYRDSQLPPDYTPFGRITRGLDLIDKVAKAGSTPAEDGQPNTGVKIKTLRTSGKA